MHDCKFLDRYPGVREYSAHSIFGKTSDWFSRDTHPLLDPVSTQTVWSINYQDVIAIGHLFLDGEIYSRRVISLAGPPVKTKANRNLLGADLEELVDNELLAGENRVILDLYYQAEKALAILIT